MTTCKYYHFMCYYCYGAELFLFAEPKLYCLILSAFFLVVILSWNIK